nr:hypothetical protein [Tanacetum cinerariifolium]
MLLSQSDQAMLLSVRFRLWRNLRDHIRIAGSEPWVLLGEFNVILKSNENSNGLNARSEGTQDFRECVDCLGVADINMNGLFYTWIQKIKNPELGVLKKLDRIMGILNLSLPTLLDVVYKFEDANSLFTKRLDYDVALDLIKPVDDKEIKEVLFSINDNKASGPDGYSSKFFKATWSVVGLVFCYQGLYEFSLSSSLYPSMSKSEAFFCGLTPKIKNDILMAMPFKKGTLPIKYLGVPLVSQKISVNDFKILIDVIQNRINDWKNRNLSFAGKLLLISSVLASLQARGDNSKSMVLELVSDFKLGDDIMRECEGIFNEVLDVLVPNIVNDFEDKVVWIDKKGREKRFSVAEAWKAVKVEFPIVIWHKQGSKLEYVFVDIHVLVQIMNLIVTGLRAFQD